MPLISVVIPTKGRCDLLVRAVDSVLAQSLRELEVIVVVDGEDSPTTLRLAELVLKEPRLRYVVNPVSLGSSQARNVGGNLASGEWIAFLDDDDEWFPEKLERQLAMPLPADHGVILSCRSLVITPRGQSVRPRRVFDNEIPFDEWLFDRRSLFGGDTFLQTSSLMMKRTIFRELQFLSPRQHDDWDLILRATKVHGLKLITAPEVLVRHYVEERRHSLASNHRIPESLAWLDSARNMITPRAYSGFCLTIIAQHAARHYDFATFWQLLRRAFGRGAPTVTQLLVFATVWIFPWQFRRHVRRWTIDRAKSLTTGILKFSN